MVFRGKKRDNEKANGEGSGIFGGFNAGGLFGGGSSEAEQAQMPADMTNQTGMENMGGPFAPNGQAPNGQAQHPQQTQQQAPMGLPVTQHAQHTQQQPQAQFIGAASPSASTHAPATAQSGSPKSDDSLVGEIEQARADVNSALDRLSDMVKRKEESTIPPSSPIAQQFTPATSPIPTASPAPQSQMQAAPVAASMAPAPGLVPPAGIPAAAVPQPEPSTPPSGYQPSTIVGIEQPEPAGVMAQQPPAQQSTPPAFEGDTATFAPAASSEAVFERAQEPSLTGMAPQPRAEIPATNLPAQRSIRPEEGLQASNLAAPSTNGSEWEAHDRAEFAPATSSAPPAEEAIPVPRPPSSEPIATVSSTSLFTGGAQSEPAPAQTQTEPTSVFGSGEAFPEIPFPNGEGGQESPFR